MDGNLSKCLKALDTIIDINKNHRIVITYDVLVELKAKQIDKTFTYLIPEKFRGKIPIGINAKIQPLPRVEVITITIRKSSRALAKSVAGSRFIPSSIAPTTAIAPTQIIREVLTNAPTKPPSSVA